MVKSKKNLLLVILSVVFALTLISFVAVRPVKAETSVITMSDKASVRLDTDGANTSEDIAHLGKDGKNGLRFTAYVDKGIVLDEDTYVGIFVARGELSVEEMKALTPAGDVIDVKAEKFDPANDSDYFGRCFNAVIYDIPAEAYTQDLTAMAYLCDGGEYTYSESVTTRSLLEVVSASLAKDNNTVEDIALLKGFLGEIETTVKLGDTVLSAGANNVTLTGGDSLAISVEPAGISYDAQVVSGKVLQITNGVVSCKKAVENATQTVLINVLGVEYEVEVTLNQWHEEADGNVIESFDTSKAIFSIQDGTDDLAGFNKSITWLDPATALAETGVESGMLKVDAGNYSVAEYTFANPVEVATTNGIYIKYKMDAALEGVMYVCINGQKSLILNNQAFRNYTPANGEWNTIVISKNDLADYYALFNGSFETIYFMPVGRAGVFYIDEIGILETPAEAWVDTEREEGVYADFNEFGYVNTVSTYADRARYNVGKITYLDAAAAKTEAGADSGVIKVHAINTYSTIRFYLQEPIDMNKIGGFRFRMKAQASDVANLLISLPGMENNADGKQNRPAWVFSHSGGADAAGYGYVKNEWFDVTFNMGSYSFDGWGVDWKNTKNPIEYVDVRVNSAACTGSWYFDEISVIKGAPEGYINDFNETYDNNYAKGHNSWHTKGFTIVQGVEGAEGGVLQINTITKGLPFTIFPERHVNGSKLSKIIIRMFVPETETTKDSASHRKVLIQFTVNTTATAGTMSDTSKLKGGKWHNFTSEFGIGNTAVKRGEWVEVEIDVAGKLSNRGIDAMKFTQNYGTTGDSWKADQPADEAPWLIDSIKYVLA